MVIDAVGVELNDGDRVAYVRPYYRALQIGIIMYLTPKGAKIMNEVSDWECNRSCDQLIKVGSG